MSAVMAYTSSLATSVRRRNRTLRRRQPANALEASAGGGGSRSITLTS